MELPRRLHGEAGRTSLHAGGRLDLADSALHARVIEKLPEALKSESSQLILGDGVKAVIDEDSWVLVRPSNTEHAIRVSVESRSEKAPALHKKMSEKVQKVYEASR